jgi:hypothetical protein
MWKFTCSDLVITSAEEYKLCGSLSGNVLVFLVSVAQERLIIILGVKDDCNASLNLCQSCSVSATGS